MRVAITGSTGMVGSALAQRLERDGHQVMPISRRPTRGGVQWNVKRRELDAAALEGLDAVIHLAGENLAARRWSETRKQELWNSRVDGTRLLCDRLGTLKRPPAVLISASASGYYDDRGDEALTETSPPGEDFLAQLCVAWEAAAEPARAAGIRVIHPRFGMILSTTGGALGRLLPLFRCGLGGQFGDGMQWMPWITLDDVISGILHCVHQREVVGAVNFSAPDPVRNRDFVHALAHALHRPAFVRAPAMALRLLLGELADQALLASQQLIPVQLQLSGFNFAHPTLEAALRELTAHSR